MTLILKSPTDLTNNNLVIDQHQTLIGSPKFNQNQKELDYWKKTLTSLHTSFVPREYQQTYAIIGASRRHNFWAHSQGCGKTLLTILQILIVYGRHLSSLRPGSIQIVAPRHTLNHVWYNEFNKVGIAHHCQVITKPDEFENSKKPIWIYYYDLAKQQTSRGLSLKKDPDLKGHRITKDGSIDYYGYPVSYLIRDKFRPKQLILDEIHRLRPGTDRTYHLTHIRKKAKRVTGLSGTPMDGYIQHLSTILEFIYGPKTINSQEFTNKFSRTEQVSTDIATGSETTSRERPVPGVSQLQIPNFIKTTRPLMHRLTLTDPEVNKTLELPPAKYHRVEITMDVKQEKLYKDLVHSLKGEAKIALKGVNRAPMLELITKLRIASSCPEALGFMSNTSKLVTIGQIAKEFQKAKRKLLIYPIYIEEARTIYNYLLTQGIKTVRLYSSDPAATPRTLSAMARENVIEKFQEDEDITCMVASLELISEGLTLTEASGIIRPTRPWKATLDMQGVSRVVRPGQVHPWVDIYDLVNLNTIDLYVEELLGRKIKATTSFMDREFNVPDSKVTIDMFELGELVFEQSSSKPQQT